MTIKMEIEITGWEIQKDTEGKYMLCPPDLNMFIHCDKLDLKKQTASTWLYMYNMNDGFKSVIGHIWIKVQNDVNKLKELIEA